jgi:HlyD family secretion protein
MTKAQAEFERINTGDRSATHSREKAQGSAVEVDADTTVPSLLEPEDSDADLRQWPMADRRSSPRGRWRWWTLAIVISIAVGLSVNRLTSRSSDKAADWLALTVPVEAKDFPVRIEASGTIDPVRTVNISPKTAGRLDALYISQGDAVEVGTVLAQMDAAEQEAALTEARAQIRQAEAEFAKVRNGNRSETIARGKAQVAAAKASADLNTERVERYTYLAQKGAISQDRLDEELSQHRSAIANLEEAQQQLEEWQTGSRQEDIELAAAKVETARAQVRRSQIQLEERRIRAPFNGVVTQTYATVGAVVTPTTAASSTVSATSTSILTLASGLEVEVSVPEATIARIQTGQSVEITADAYPNRVFRGRVSRVAPEAVVEDNVTSFEVRVALETGRDRLRSGMNVDATFVGELVQDAAIVPTVAIASQQGTLGVQVADERGRATFRPVTVGVSQDGQTQVLQGLQAGERVFIDFPAGQPPTSIGPLGPNR